MSSREPQGPLGDHGPGPASDPARTLLPAPGEPWTPILLTRWSGAYLGEKGVENGRLDAELLLAAVLGMKRLDLYLQHDRPLQSRELDAFKTLLKRRAAREPLQYILGTTSFRELELRTDVRALIPRPETEVLVEEVLRWVRDKAGRPGWAGPLRALDVGTGTGAIALSLLKEGPFGEVVATDPSPQALTLAGENASETGLVGLELREGSLLEPLHAGERFHVLVSNPPYIPDGDREGLQPEIRDWEPPLALFAGPEGLEVVAALVREASSALFEGGLLALEVGDGQASRVARLMEETEAYAEIHQRADLSGRNRVILGVASGGEMRDL